MNNDQPITIYTVYQQGAGHEAFYQYKCVAEEHIHIVHKTEQLRKCRHLPKRFVMEITVLPEVASWVHNELAEVKGDIIKRSLQSLTQGQ